MTIDYRPVPKNNKKRRSQERIYIYTHISFTIIQVLNNMLLKYLNN